MGKGWVGVSVWPREGMVYWPNNPPVRRERMTETKRESTANVLKKLIGGLAHRHSLMVSPSTWPRWARASSTRDRSSLDGARGWSRSNDPESVKPDEVSHTVFTTARTTAPPPGRP